MEIQTVRTTGPAESNTKKSISYKIMKFIYQITLIFFCLDFGFFVYKSKKQRTFWKSVAIIQCMILTSLCIFTLDSRGSTAIVIWSSTLMVEFLLSASVLILVNPSATICKFHSYLEVIDSKMQVNHCFYNNLETHLLIAYIIDTSYRIIVCLIYCFLDNKCLQPVVTAVVYLGLAMSLNIIVISYSFVFYALNGRLKNLASILDSDSVDITTLQHAYKLIVTCADTYKCVFSPTYVIMLIFCIPEVMGSIYTALQEVLEPKTNSLILKSVYLSESESLALLLAPAFFAGLLSSQADRINIILHHKLMQERDDTKIYEIKRFIEYVAAHPCRFLVYKVIPLDADLLTLVINFCVTYLIIIIQFTNF